MLPWIRQLQLGPAKNFIYLVGAPSGREAFVVDPAWDVPAILTALEGEERKLTGVILTHHHHDHVNGVPQILERLDVPVFAQRTELEFAPQVFAGYRGALRPVAADEQITLAGIDVTCLATPGHTPGAHCLHCGGAVITGDTLFVNACGRCDFEGGDVKAMYRSLYEVLGRLPGETEVFAGHDYGDVKVSTLSRERAQNPYFQHRDLASFVAHRLPPKRS